MCAMCASSLSIERASGRHLICTAFSQGCNMATNPGGPDDDVSSAPESGTVRDDTSGNQPANPQERGAPVDDQSKQRCSGADKQNGDKQNGDKQNGDKQNRDNPRFAGEER